MGSSRLALYSNYGGRDCLTHLGTEGPLVASARLNETWALDFMADALYDGRGFRTFNVLDEGDREALAIEVGTSIPSARVIRVLDDLITLYGRPTRVRVDNGPELTAEAFVDWCAAQRTAIGYIQPGKPRSLSIGMRQSVVEFSE
jgi:putative transposase